LKNVSKADRFTSAGSASTWPKSGLIVPVNDSDCVTAYFMSRPTAPPGSGVSSSGLPGCAGRV
jgi:hypothetical protein